MMRHIPLIIDCDNTMGVPGCDIDDGIAILYLLGCEEADLIGISCAYGNSTQETVYNNTRRLMKSWGREDIPVLRGCGDPGFRKRYMESGAADDRKISRRSDAAEFLAEMAERYSGELCILATGSMSNLAGAEELDPGFFSKVRTISCMGGITGELLVGGLPMDELNLSCDPYAAYRVIAGCADLRIASAQNSLKSYFDREEFEDRMSRGEGALADMLRRECGYWFDLNERQWKLSGAVIWDVMAAVQLLHPESLDMKKAVITADAASLRRGSLYGDGEAAAVLLPEIRDSGAYIREVYERLFSADISPAAAQ